MKAADEEPRSVASAHPEEIKSVFELKVGRFASLQGSARITPAGALSTGLAVAAILLATGYVVASARRARRG